MPAARQAPQLGGGPEIDDGEADEMASFAPVAPLQRRADDVPTVRSNVPPRNPDLTARTEVGGDGNDVFVVHGHDGEAKIKVALFLSRLLGREPLILHEQPDRGCTIIEKFEHHAARAGCAVVLLTGDDNGGPLGGSQHRRARQNVVFELGFFVGTLGRDRVIILYEPQVELPSDLNGVLYIQLDDHGSWRNALARELAQAGIEVNLHALLS